MKRLGEKTKVRGTGISGLTSTLIKRTEHVAMYLRSDGYYETGIIKITKEDTLMPNGKIILAGEHYWGNEDFGDYAKTTSNKERAEKRPFLGLKRLFWWAKLTV